ncbi:hypothetical protein C8Q80DRAFT_609633 [Daedaleopsis nitida]|nr:hypothetical protein C8Q80DRAFT_609633 [Daedaleopsis nitida]
MISCQEIGCEACTLARSPAPGAYKDKSSSRPSHLHLTHSSGQLFRLTHLATSISFLHTPHTHVNAAPSHPRPFATPYRGLERRPSCTRFGEPWRTGPGNWHQQQPSPGLEIPQAPLRHPVLRYMD